MLSRECFGISFFFFSDTNLNRVFMSSWTRAKTRFQNLKSTLQNTGTTGNYRNSTRVSQVKTYLTVPANYNFFLGILWIFPPSHSSKLLKQFFSFKCIPLERRHWRQKDGWGTFSRIPMSNYFDMWTFIHRTPALSCFWKSL